MHLGNLQQILLASFHLSSHLPPVSYLQASPLLSPTPQSLTKPHLTRCSPC